MNWLAHLQLADLAGADLAASLLPDLVNVTTLSNLSDQQKIAIQLHQAIDRFTDAHPVVKRSKTLISPPYRRFAGILVDMFYDYCLSQVWAQYHPTPLDHFIAQSYTALLQNLSSTPEKAHRPLRYLVEQNWLGEYQTLQGIERSLQRVSQRFKRPTHLSPALIDLREQENTFIQEFQIFYPDLLTHSKQSLKH